jgi:hypothetical protein
MSLGLSGYQDMDKTKERWERFWIEVERMPTLPTLHNNTLRVEEICPSCYKEQANSWGWVRGVSITWENVCAEVSYTHFFLDRCPK